MVLAKTDGSERWYDGADEFAEAFASAEDHTTEELSYLSTIKREATHDAQHSTPEVVKLSKEARAAMDPEMFAVPRSKILPIHDAYHIHMSWGTVNATKGLTQAERKEARQRIIERADALGMDTSDWDSGKINSSLVLNAMSLNIANDDHPNKMPFSGVMTRIDEPSDAPPEGSGGRLITISSEAAEKGLKSLLGMAIDYKPGLDGHAPQNKIGIITAATIEGNAILIEGFLYASDFPEVAAEIKANKDDLGFSYEARNLWTLDPDANPVVISDCVFTGAAILRKDKAAYHTTSLQASKEIEEMTPELKLALDKMTADQAEISKALATLSASVVNIEATQVSAANYLSKVEPHASKLENCAAEMEAAGIGGDSSNGHAVALRKMAGHMRAEAAVGRMPSVWHGGSVYGAGEKKAETDPGFEAAMKPLTDKLAALGTQIADMKAAAVKDSPAPERKTIPKEFTALLAKHGIGEPEDGGKIDMAKLDGAMKELPVSQRLQVKAGLRQSGMIA